MKTLTFALLTAFAAAQNDGFFGTEAEDPVDDEEDDVMLGKSCVSPQLTSLFNNINEIIELSTKSSSYTDYLTLKYADGTGANPQTTQNYQNNQFSLRQSNVDTTTVYTQSIDSYNQIDQGIEYMQYLNASLRNKLQWSEGLALGAQAYADAWAQNIPAQSVSVRMGENRQLPGSGKIVEAIFTYDAYYIDPVDFTRLTITNNGSGNGLGAALFDAGSNFRSFGAAYKVQDGCFPKVKNEYTDPPQQTNSCKVVLVVAAAENYINKYSVRECNTKINFGGGICDPDPDTMTEEIYKELINMRKNAFSEYRPYLQQIRNSCNNGGVDWNLNGDVTECPQDYDEKTQIAINSISTTMDNLGHLEWIPGLTIGAKTATGLMSLLDWNSALAMTQQALLSKASWSKFGDKGQILTGILYAGDNTPKNAVSRMLIDNFDGTATQALLNTAVTEVGLSIAKSNTFTNIGVIILDNGFQTFEPFDVCKVPVNQILDVIIPMIKIGAIGLGLTTTTTAIMAALI